MWGSCGILLLFWVLPGDLWCSCLADRTLVSMRTIETVHAEPRESVNLPVYRVNFWQQPPPGAGWSLDAYVLTEVDDINEVLLWVDEHAHGRRVEVFAEMDEEPVGSFETPRKAGLVRLLGTNPNEEEGVTIEFGSFVKD